jgi:hypothetical protein
VSLTIYIQSRRRHFTTAPWVPLCYLDQHEWCIVHRIAVELNRHRLESSNSVITSSPFQIKVSRPFYLQSAMSQSTLDLTEKACTPADHKDPRPASTGKPLKRSPFTKYGDGIVQYAYRPPKGKGEGQRLCGVLGKDRLVSPLTQAVSRREHKVEETGNR